jgi:F-type H+-transporting ATPase subunit b
MDLLTPEFGLFFWTLVAFLTVFFILKKFAWKPILNSLTEREKGIADSIATADKVKQEMSQLQAENEKIMAQAREERTQMLSEARRMSEQIVTKAKEDTKLIADKMISDAQVQIEQQKMAALTEVKNEIGTLAITVAEKILRSKLATKEDQSSYINMLSEEIKMN